MTDLGGTGDTLQSLIIDGLPQGATLPVGADGSAANVAGWNLADLSITMPSAETFTLTAVATTQDAQGNVSTATATEPVTVAAAVAPLLATSSALVATPLVVTSAASVSYNDGSANAPAGSPEMPNRLAGLAARPPWEVAGVDYSVGVPQGTALREPSTISMAGVSVNAGSHTISITGSNITLNGYDFTSGGGWGITVGGGASNTTIENSSFLVGSNEHVPINASGGNLTVLNDTFNGGSQTSTAVWAMVAYNGSGTFTSEYSSYLNTPEDAIDFGGSSQTDLVEYNLFQNLGTSPGAHADVVQYDNTRSTNSVIAFNTVTSGEEGIQIDAQGGSSTLTNTTVDNNTIIAPSGQFISYLIAVQEQAGTVNGIQVESNHLDDSNAYGFFYPPAGSNMVFGANINMATGATIANPGGATAGSGSGAGPGTVGSGGGSTGSGSGAGSGSTPSPKAVADSAGVEENKAVTIAVLANDTDTGGTLNPGSVQISAGPADGTVSVNATTGAVTYTPNSGYFGTDTFQYSVADTSGVRSAAGTVTVTVDAPPVAASDDPSTPENTPVTINLLSSVSDPLGTINPASITVSTGAAHGTTSVNPSTGVVTYTPNAGYTGPNSFQYTVANTLGGVSAPGTVTINVTPPSGSGSGTGSGGPTTSSGFVDGSGSAPAGSPELSTVLNGYAVRPPWQVAGVDYAVGVPSGMALLDPSTISMSGVSVNAGNHTVTISGNNVTLKGYDFGLANGWQVIVNGANDTIEDSRFTVGSNQGSSGNVLNVTSSASSFSLLDNEINGNNIAVTSQQGQTVSINSSGTLTIQYNYLHNSGGDMIDLNASKSAQIDIIQYNLFENIGVNTAHADTIQWYNTTTGAGSDIGFNTVYQNVNQPGAGNGALVPLAEGPNATMTGLTLNNNTIIQTANDSQGNFSTGFYADMGGTASNVVIHDNYVDPTGPMGWTGSPWFPTGSYSDNLPQPSALSNLIDMVTGKPIVVPSASSKTSQGYYTYADGSGYTPALSDVYGVKASQTSGTLGAGNTVTFTVTMDLPYSVTGAPVLTLNDGGTASYVSGSGTNTLVFSYTVASGNTAVSSLGITGVSLPSGASINDAVGNAANMAGIVASFSGLAVNPGSGSGSGGGSGGGSGPSPTAVANSATTEAGQPATIAVLANDSDPGGTLNPASVLVSTGAGHGTASVNTSTGAITYTPTAGFAGTDSFQYTVADISGVRSAPATVTVTVDAPPTTAPDSAATVENQAVSIAVLSKDSDSVGTINPASVTVSSGAAHGTTAVNSSTGAITYTPAAGFTGTDSFQYTVANTLGGVSAPATVTVTVAAPSTGGAPTTAADSGTTEQNQALSIAVLANDSDPGGTINPGSVAVSSGAAHGTTTVNASTGAITYTPTAGFTGTDSFQYTVANTLGSTSAPATVSVTVDAPPKAAADSAVTAENQPVTIAVLGNDSDPLGTINPGSVAVSSGAAHGTASVNASTGAITYTPTTGFTGTDTFQYTVANTQGGVSAPATVIVQVNAPSSGGGSPPPPPPGSGFTDGSAGAPAGTPQLPTLLSGYAVRPPWEVAGVDYAVGVQVPAGAALLDPSAIAMTGVAVNTANHTVTVTGNNVTLNGIDFGRDNGWQVIVKGANDTIENSRFMVGSNQGSNGNVLDVTASASNFSLLGNEINGNNVAVTAQQGQTVSIDSSGTLTIQYNYLHNSGGDMIDLGASNGPQTDIIQYNLFANIGVNTAHADTIQWYNTTTGAGSDIGFNTVYENVNQPGAGNGGLVPLAEGPNATMAGLMLNNNTIIQTAADTDANFSLGFYADMGGTAANVTIHDNYVDPTGPLGYTGSPWFPTGFYGANLATQTVESNTVDMVTGAVISVPSAAAKTEQGYYTYADASGNAPALSDVISVTPSLPAGSQINPGDTVTFTLHLDEAFTVSGTPTLALNDGGTATYVGGSGSSALTFSYTVGNSDVTLPSLAITGVNLPGGATVKDSVGNAANLAGAVGSFAIAVDPPNSPPPPATQLPNLFAGDATRPSWQVAGVDYAVGVPASTALKTPAGIVMKGVSVNATTHVINVTGNGVTLNGYDFSLNGGWRVNVTGKNDTIENSNFAVGANQQIPITAGASATNLSVLYNTIDGGGASANPSAITALISDTGTGLKVEYNWLKNAPQTVIAVRGGTLLDEFNLVQNVGFGAGSAESDLTFSGGVSNNSVISFNTIYNPPHADEPTNLASGLQIEAQNTATLSNTEVENNTIISPGPTPTNSYLIAIHQDAGSNIVNGVNVQDNYLDSTGATAAYFPSTAATNVAFVGNTNLKTGGVVPGIPGTASSNVVGVSAGGGTATPGTKVTITVTMNEAMTVSGKPTLSLNDGGTATYSGGSGTNTLTFTSTISTGNVAVPALAITGVNLPAGSIIVDAAGDAANLSGITQALSGAPAVSTAAVPAGASAPITATSSALVAPAGSSSGSSTGSSSGSSSGAVLGVSSNALAFIAPPAGTDTATAGSAMPDWLSVAAGDAGSGNPVHLLGGWQPGVPLPGDHATDGGIPASTGATWTTLPMFATIGTATEHAQG